MKNAFVELEELIREWDCQQAEPLSGGQRSILVELARREDEGTQTKITNIIQQIRFGTGPTVHNHLKKLEALKFIKKVVSETDARATCLILTRVGRDYLQALDTLVRTACK